MKSTSRVVEQLKDEQLLKVKEFAELLGVCKRKAFEILAQGSVPVVTLGPRSRRVRLADALAWIQSRTRSASVTS